MEQDPQVLPKCALHCVCMCAGRCQHHSHHGLRPRLMHACAKRQQNQPVAAHRVCDPADMHDGPACTCLLAALQGPSPPPTCDSLLTLAEAADALDQPPTSGSSMLAAAAAAAAVTAPGAGAEQQGQAAPTPKPDAAPLTAAQRQQLIALQCANDIYARSEAAAGTAAVAAGAAATNANTPPPQQQQQQSPSGSSAEFSFPATVRTAPGASAASPTLPVAAAAAAAAAASARLVHRASLQKQLSAELASSPLLATVVEKLVRQRRQLAAAAAAAGEVLPSLSADSSPLSLQLGSVCLQQQQQQQQGST